MVTVMLCNKPISAIIGKLPIYKTMCLGGGTMVCENFLKVSKQKKVTTYGNQSNVLRFPI